MQPWFVFSGQAKQFNRARILRALKSEGYKWKYIEYMIYWKGNQDWWLQVDRGKQETYV